MSKAKSNEFVSISNIAVMHGKAENQAHDCAVLALEHIKGFPVLKDVSEENIQLLRDGYATTHKEVFKPETYAVINGHYIKPTPEQISAKNVEKITLTLDYCMSFTPNEMGTEFKERPELKKMIADVRKAHSTYISQKLNRLVDTATKIIKARSGVTTTREVVMFDQAITKFFDAQIKSVKVKEKRGDATANPAKFLTAVEAFWRAYKA